MQDLKDFVARALGMSTTTTTAGYRSTVFMNAAPGSSGGTGAGSSTSTHTGCGIVYCRTRDGCQSLAGRLSNNGIKSRAYHAGQSTLCITMFVCVCVSEATFEKKFCIYL